MKKKNREGSVSYSIDDASLEDDSQQGYESVPGLGHLSPVPSCDLADVSDIDRDAVQHDESVHTAQFQELRNELEERIVELNLQKSALEGLQKQCRILEDKQVLLAAEQASLTQKNATLELQQEAHKFQTEEDRLTIEGLRKENALLQSRLEEMASFAAHPPTNSSIPGTQGGASKDAAVLEQDLADMTAKYIDMRLQLMDAQEDLRSIETREYSGIKSRLDSEKQKADKNNAQLQLAEARIELLQQAASGYQIKMANRDSQIQFLEEALMGYQLAFKEKVESYQEHLAKMQNELAMYKRAMDGLNDDDAMASDASQLSPNSSLREPDAMLTHRPKVVAPIRGRSVISRQASNFSFRRHSSNDLLRAAEPGPGNFGNAGDEEDDKANHSRVQSPRQTAAQWLVEASSSSEIP